jgi:hypothetical protein
VNTRSGRTRFLNQAHSMRRDTTRVGLGWPSDENSVKRPPSSPVSLASMGRCGFPAAKNELERDNRTAGPATRSLKGRNCPHVQPRFCGYSDISTWHLQMSELPVNRPQCAPAPLWQGQWAGNSHSLRVVATSLTRNRQMSMQTRVDCAANSDIQLQNDARSISLRTAP